MYVIKNFTPNLASLSFSPNNHASKSPVQMQEPLLEKICRLFTQLILLPITLLTWMFPKTKKIDSCSVKIEKPLVDSSFKNFCKARNIRHIASVAAIALLVGGYAYHAYSTQAISLIPSNDVPPIPRSFPSCFREYALIVATTTLVILCAIKKDKGVKKASLRAPLKIEFLKPLDSVEERQKLKASLMELEDVEFNLESVKDKIETEHYPAVQAYEKDKTLPSEIDPLLKILQVAEHIGFRKLQNACLDKLFSQEDQLKYALDYFIKANEVKLTLKLLPLVITPSNTVEIIKEVDAILDKEWVKSIEDYSIKGNYAIAGTCLNAQYKAGLITLEELKDALTFIMGNRHESFLERAKITIEEEALALEIYSNSLAWQIFINFYSMLVQIQPLTHLKFAISGIDRPQVRTGLFPQVTTVTVKKGPQCVSLENDGPSSICNFGAYPKLEKVVMENMEECLDKYRDQIPSQIPIIKIK